MTNLEKETKSIVDQVPLGGTVLDIGSGFEAPYQRPVSIRASKLVMMDAHRPYLDANKTVGPNVFRVCGRVPEALPEALAIVPHFDVALLVDFIEHLDMATGRGVIRELQQVADRIVIFTPEGWMFQNHDPYLMHGDHWQTHRSGWTAYDVAELGFRYELWEDFWIKDVAALFAVWNREVL